MLEEKPEVLEDTIYFLNSDLNFVLQDPKLYVSTILEVHRKYNNLVLTAFTNDCGFVASLDKACGKFINNNSVTKNTSSTSNSSKSPELLAKYCDHLLKRNVKNPEEAELEDTLNQVVIFTLSFAHFWESSKLRTIRMVVTAFTVAQYRIES